MSDEELVDDELTELEQMKSQILAKAIQSRKEFLAWEKTEEKMIGKKKSQVTIETNEFQELITKDVVDKHRVNSKCVGISNFLMGMKFNNADKKWISHHTYLYKADVKTTVLEFHLEVTTLNNKDTIKGNKTLEIVCNFIDLRQCFFLEMSSWVERFTKANDIPNLFSAITDYSECNVMRSKFLKKLKANKIAYAEECNENEGGVMIFLHARDEADFIYFKIRWALKFVDNNWQIDNSFIIHPVSATSHGIMQKNAVEANQDTSTISKTLWAYVPCSYDTSREPETESQTLFSKCFRCCFTKNNERRSQTNISVHFTMGDDPPVTLSQALLCLENPQIPSDLVSYPVSEEFILANNRSQNVLQQPHVIRSTQMLFMGYDISSLQEFDIHKSSSLDQAEQS